MTRLRSGRARIVVNSVVALALGFAAMALFLWWLRPAAESVDAEVSEGAVSVADLTNLVVTQTHEVTVTGFVFVGKERTILCGSRDRAPDPYCIGPAITVTGLDTSRIDLVYPEDGPAWSRDEVTLLGPLSMLTLDDPEIVQ